MGFESESSLSFRNAQGIDCLDHEDNAKISSIAEVCHVSTDEAASVLVACRMDEALAIERFLSGEVKTSTWSEVSKKKKHTPFRPRTGRGVRKVESTVKHTEEVDGVYSKRENPSLNQVVSRRTHPVLNRAGNGFPVFRGHSAAELGGAEKEVPKEVDEGSCIRGRVTNCSSVELKRPSNDNAKSCYPSSSSSPCPPIANYLASSVAASEDGTGRHKFSDSVMNQPIPPTPISEESEGHGRTIEDVVRDVSDRSSSKFISAQVDDECKNGTANQPAVEVSTVPGGVDRNTNAEVDNARPRKSCSTASFDREDGSMKSLPKSIILSRSHLACNSITESKKVEHEFVVQFGSFGLSSMNSLDWCPSAVNYPDSDKKHEVVESSSSVGTGGTIGGNELQHSRASLVKQCLVSTESMTPLDESAKAGRVSVECSARTVPVAVTSTISSPSYPSYASCTVPNVLNTNSFNSTESNETSNLREALPVYKPNIVCHSQTSGGVRIHELAELQEDSRMAGEFSHKEPAQPVFTEADKTNIVTNCANVQASLDPISAPYMVPSYPILMPSYPSLQYAPPGIAPHGAGHFTYATMGQLSNSTPYNPYHSQNSNFNKVSLSSNGTRAAALEEGAPNTVRNVTGTIETSVFPPANYIAASENSHPKNSEDQLAYRNISRAGGPGNGFGSSLHSIVPGAHISNVPYDYSVVSQSLNVGQLPVGNLNPASWGSRQLSSGRADGSNSGGYQLNGIPGYYGNGYY